MRFVTIYLGSFRDRRFHALRLTRSHPLLRLLESVALASCRTWEQFEGFQGVLLFAKLTDKLTLNGGRSVLIVRIRNFLDHRRAEMSIVDGADDHCLGMVLGC